MTGSHRSGTTWLANMLSLADGSLMGHEPFNIEPWAYSLGGLADRWFTYAPGLRGRREKTCHLTYVASPPCPVKCLKSRKKQTRGIS